MVVGLNGRWARACCVYSSVSGGNSAQRRRVREVCGGHVQRQGRTSGVHRLSAGPQRLAGRIGQRQRLPCVNSPCSVHRHRIDKYLISLIRLQSHTQLLLRCDWLGRIRLIITRAVRHAHLAMTLFVNGRWLHLPSCLIGK